MVMIAELIVRVGQTISMRVKNATNVIILMVRDRFQGAEAAC